MKFFMSLLLLLCCAAPVTADEDFYEYGMRILLSPPLVVTGSGSAVWRVAVPEFAIVGQAYLKNCKIHGLETPTEFDEHITLYQMGANFSHGGYKILVGDRKEGRTQVYCLRLPYTPLEEP